ncbi:acetyltransferase, GNAT family [Metarhizium album ARSEF 1941]|uniref:Acetyltransferase, GNAT family n=1 Tax=Metarhizium album (strain ARSEF 1941) TaxID=1081103 RepID=A0A0B2WSQ0_METAS|nr:acetyltransferase, GNAT family [Metarhizium album ARSEF 1941]KHN95980.1 acetyltransferase, GNAT family [Metarhizium album ARSEF 1941]
MSSTTAVPTPANPSVAANNASNRDHLPLPPLTFSVVTREVDKQDAMRLVADSIAQQRQTASLAIIFHPACFAGLAAACAAVYRHNARGDFGTALVTLCGLVLAYLAGVRLLTADYIRLAEGLRWKEWIAGPDGREDHVLAARFGDELIATAVLRLVAAAGPNKKTRPSSLRRGGSGVIRAWTTKYRCRGKGVGGDMLRLAILTTRSICGEGAQVTFDPDHANSARPLHNMFNRPFVRRDERAKEALAHALEACDRGQSSFQME